VTDLEDLAAALARLLAQRQQQLLQQQKKQGQQQPVQTQRRTASSSSGAASSSTTDYQASKARFDSLHERRALLAAISHLVSSRSLSPEVAGALARLVHNRDPLTIAAFRLFVQTEDAEEFVDTLTRVGTAALESSEGEAAAVVEDANDSGWGGEAAAAAAPADARAESGRSSETITLSRQQRDHLLRCAIFLRDEAQVISSQEAAALVRSIVAAQSGQYESEEDTVAAPTLRSIIDVYSRSKDPEGLLGSLVRVARILGPGAE
jgi:hypothetical protein